MILDEILKKNRKRLAVEKQVKSIDVLEREARFQSAPRDFCSAFFYGRTNIIAEIKKASPSKGIIDKDVNPANKASLYEAGGASAISVLTERHFFKGSLCDLREVKKAVSIPVLRKDFIFDEYQIVEARAAGADSFLLIAAILKIGELKSLLQAGRYWGMEPLVEVHDRHDLESAISAGASIIGINNRDLRTFSVDLNVTFELIKYIPKDCIVISESGIRRYEDISMLSKAGVRGFLIGESLMRAADPVSKLREFIHDC